MYTAYFAQHSDRIVTVAIEPGPLREENEAWRRYGEFETFRDAVLDVAAGVAENQLPEGEIKFQAVGTLFLQNIIPFTHETFDEDCAAELDDGEGILFWVWTD